VALWSRLGSEVPDLPDLVFKTGCFVLSALDLALDPPEDFEAMANPDCVSLRPAVFVGDEGVDLVEGDEDLVRCV